MWPKPGDHPRCCENGGGAITFKAAEGKGDTEGFAAWTIPFYMGGTCLSTEIHFCPFCGRRLSGSWRDGKEAVKRFKEALPAAMVESWGLSKPDADLLLIVEALYVAFIDPIERRLEERKPHDKYAGQPAHAAAGWHPDDDGHG